MTAAAAQQTPDNSTAPLASVDVSSSWFSVVGIPPIPNAPFSATTVMDNTQTLADGTTVITKTMTTIARDSKGRKHNENRYYLTLADNGEGRIRDITIFDPTTHSRTTLNPSTQHASVSIQPSESPNHSHRTIQQGIPREDLGLSSIGGLAVKGFRQFQTIPEGEDGNDRPITITDEYWYSEELQMNITLKHMDPRHGTQMVTLTKLSREEPDPKMFEVPPDYNVRDETSAPEAIKVSGAVAEANLIEHPQPVYPPLAKTAHVQGSVKFTVLIGKDGSVKNVQLVSGHLLLVNAAKEAVIQWRYLPTLLNGTSVDVVTSVVVNFTLAN